MGGLTVFPTTINSLNLRSRLERNSTATSENLVLSYVLTNNSVSPRNNGCDSISRVNTIWKPCCHGFTHKTTKCRSYKTSNNSNDWCLHSQSSQAKPTRKIPLVCYLRVESVGSCRSHVHLYIPAWVKPIKVINHENNILPIKKTGKKTPAGMGKATDTAVIINCNKKAKRRENLFGDKLQTASLQNHNVTQTTALFNNMQPFK